MMVKGTNIGSTVVSFASAGAETKVLASFASGILPIVHAIYRRRSIIVISSRCLPRVVLGRYGLMLGINDSAWFTISVRHVLHIHEFGLKDKLKDCMKKF